MFHLFFYIYTCIQDKKKATMKRFAELQVVNCSILVLGL